LEGQSEKVVAYDSTYILDYLDTMHPEKPMLPDNPTDRLLEKKIQMLAERLMEVTQIIFFELQRPAETQSQPWLERQSKKIATGLAALDQLLADKRLPAVDDPITLGDVALGTTLSIFEFADVGMPIRAEFGFREKHPRLGEYLDALVVRPSFAMTVPVMFDTDLKKTV
jgi:glutathione S-transferase